MIRKIRFLLALIKAVKDPNQTEKIGEVIGKVADPARFQRSIEKISQHPGALDELNEMKAVPLIDMDRLKRCAQGTLGAGVYTHLKSNGLDPNLLPLEVTDITTYVRSRYRKTHDIWHVVCGYSISIFDEFALQAFTFAQLHAPGSAMILAIGLLHYVIFKPTELPELVEAMVVAYNRGKSARFLLTVPWEMYWDKPLDEVRREFGITPARPTPVLASVGLDH